jgi:heme/copper-type cytochrome/quinol oxidase subunit 2
VLEVEIIDDQSKEDTNSCRYFGELMEPRGASITFSINFKGVLNHNNDSKAAVSPASVRPPKTSKETPPELFWTFVTPVILSLISFISVVSKPKVVVAKKERILLGGLCCVSSSSVCGLHEEMWIFDDLVTDLKINATDLWKTKKDKI